MRRRAVQVLSMLIYNADVSRWFSGGISRSSLKHVCVPGLNCYSCPGAIASCFLCPSPFLGKSLYFLL